MQLDAFDIEVVQYVQRRRSSGIGPKVGSVRRPLTAEERGMAKTLAELAIAELTPAAQEPDASSPSTSYGTDQAASSSIKRRLDLEDVRRPIVFDVEGHKSSEVVRREFLALLPQTKPDDRKLTDVFNRDQFYVFVANNLYRWVLEKISWLGFIAEICVTFDNCLATSNYDTETAAKITNSGSPVALIFYFSRPAITDREVVSNLLGCAIPADIVNKLHHVYMNHPPFIEIVRRIIDATSFLDKDCAGRCIERRAFYSVASSILSLAFPSYVRIDRVDDKFLYRARILRKFESRTETGTQDTVLVDLRLWNDSKTRDNSASVVAYPPWQSYPPSIHQLQWKDPKQQREDRSSPRGPQDCYPESRIEQFLGWWVSPSWD